MTRRRDPRVVLKRGRERRVKAGHLWVYEGEIDTVDDRAEPGEAVEIVDSARRFLGRGYYNPASRIRIRVMTRRPDEPLDAALLRRRIAQAIAARRPAYDPGDTCRMVFSEGDRLPGLTVDRYGSWLVVQISTLGMDRRREPIADALQDALHPHGIYERSDLSVRSHEGLPPRTGVLRGEVPDTATITIDGLRFPVGMKQGPKTGLFLDHRFNRRALQAHAAGRRVLDAFCNTGSFMLYALAAGAESAIGLEASADCVALGRQALELNGFSGRASFVEGNAFDHLKAMDRSGERFGLIVLDPPAFTKSAASLLPARRGYKEINLRAFRLAAPGGVIVTSSCSYHLTAEAFLEVIREAAADAGRDINLLELRGQAPDHPVNLAVPESRYLKCAFLRVIS